jgi:hypothetical protein
LTFWFVCLFFFLLLLDPNINEKKIWNIEVFFLGAGEGRLKYYLFIYLFSCKCIATLSWKRRGQHHSFVIFNSFFSFSHFWITISDHKRSKTLFSFFFTTSHFKNPKMHSLKLFSFLFPLWGRWLSWS